MKIRHIIIIAVFIIVNAIVMLALFGGGGPPQLEEDKDDKFVLNLKAAIFDPVTERFEISSYGNVASYNSLDVISEVQGKVTWGNATLKPGSKVKKGSLLYSINSAELRYSLRARKSGFINLIAGALPDIKIDFASEYNKWSKYLESIKLNENLPTLPGWKSDKEKVFLSSRQILTEYFSIKATEEQLKKYAFYAPYSGMVKEVYVSEHSIVNPGSPILKLVENSNFEIPVSMPISHKDKFKSGTEVNINSSGDERLGTGTISRIAEILNPNTQSITVFIKPDSDLQSSLVDGQYVKVTMLQEEAFTGMRVPYSSIKNSSIYVYSKKDSTLTLKPVSEVHENDEGVFITGLNANEVIIKQEVLNYSDTTQYGVIFE